MSEKKKILMIDDEVDLCSVVKANLEDTGEYEVIILNDPAQAEAIAKQTKPDLILLDNVMPKRKGSDIVPGLRKDPETQRIPIIMVSGKGEMVYNKKKEEFKWIPNSPVVKERGQLPAARSAEELSQAYGVNDYVAKPFTTQLLLEIIQDVLKRTKKKPEQEEEPQQGV